KLMYDNIYDNLLKLLTGRIPQIKIANINVRADIPVHLKSLLYTLCNKKKNLKKLSRKDLANIVFNTDEYFINMSFWDFLFKILKDNELADRVDLRDTSNALEASFSDTILARYIVKKKERDKIIKKYE